jgi:hypothetical protein
VVLIKVDKLVALSRETVRQVANLDKLWKVSINHYKKPIEEIYYGSSMGGSSDSLDQWGNAIKLNYGETLIQLEKLTAGKIEKKVTKVNAYDADAWAAFFKT